MQEKAVSRENELFTNASRTIRERTRKNATLEAPADFSLARLQLALPMNTTLVEYYSTGDRLIAAVITRESIKISICQRGLPGPPLSPPAPLSAFKISNGGCLYSHFEQPLLSATQATWKRSTQNSLLPSANISTPSI